MFMDGANDYQEEGNFLLGVLKYFLGFPLYIIFDFDKHLNQSSVPFELILIFTANTAFQWFVIKGLKKLKF